MDTGLIIAGLILTLVGMIAFQIWPRYRDWPKIEIQAQPINPGSNLGSHDVQIFTYKQIFVLQNLTPYDACSLEIYGCDNFQKLTVKEKPVQLCSGQESVFSVSVSVTVNRNEVITKDGRPREPHDIRFARHKPDEIKSFEMVLQYKNRRGKRFWTKFVWNELREEQATLTHHRWRKPTIS